MGLLQGWGFRAGGFASDVGGLRLWCLAFVLRLQGFSVDPAGVRA